MKIPKEKIDQCVGWIIDNVKLSEKIKVLEIYEIVESAFSSGYITAKKECSEKIKELEVLKWKYEELNK